jgi:hypothetical protein
MILSRVDVTYETVFKLDGWIYCHLVHSHNSGLQAMKLTDHSLLSSVDVKNGGAIPPLSIRLHAVVLN